MTKIKSFEDMPEPNTIVLPDDEYYEYIDLFQGTEKDNNKDKKYGVAFFRGIRVIKWSKVKSLAGT